MGCKFRVILNNGTSLTMVCRYQLAWIDWSFDFLGYPKMQRDIDQPSARKMYEYLDKKATHALYNDAFS